MVKTATPSERIWKARLSGARLEGADLSGANLAEVLFQTEGDHVIGTYSPLTRWPEGFDPSTTGFVCVEEHC
jgi:hypothetical protein